MRNQRKLALVLRTRLFSSIRVNAQRKLHSFNTSMDCCAPNRDTNQQWRDNKNYSATFKSVSQLLRCLLQWVHHASSESKNKQKIVRKKSTDFTTFLRKYLNSWPETHFRRRESVLWTVLNHFNFSWLSDNLWATSLILKFVIRDCLKSYLEPGVSLRHLFLGIFLFANVAKVGAVSTTYIGRNTSLPAKEYPLSSCHNLQCEQSLWKQALWSNIRQPKVRSLTLLVPGSLRIITLIDFSQDLRMSTTPNCNRR